MVSETRGKSEPSNKCEFCLCTGSYHSLIFHPGKQEVLSEFGDTFPSRKRHLRKIRSRATKGYGFERALMEPERALEGHIWPPDQRLPTPPEIHCTIPMIRNYEKSPSFFD